MWRVIEALFARRLLGELRSTLDRATDRLSRVARAVVVMQAALLLLVFSIGFGLAAVFFQLSDLIAYVRPAWLTALVALVPALATLAIARDLFRR